MAVYWNMLANYANPGEAFADSLKQGMQTRRQDMARNALAALVQNPNDPTALANLARVDPSTAMDFRTQQAKLSQENVKQFQTTIDAGASAMQRLTSQGVPLEQAYQTVRQTLISNGFPGAEHIPPQADEQYIKGIMALAKPDPANNGQLVPFTPGGGVARINPQTHQLEVLVQPNPGGATPGSPVGPPPAAIARLKANPSEAAQFDEVFGPGAAAKALGDAGGNASGGFPSGGQ